MSKNTPAERLYFEIADAIDLLDNVTAATDRDADDLGQAELALVRAREIILKTSLHLIDEAPAMLAALRNLLSDMETVGCIDFYDQDLCQGVGGAVSDARAILSRIDGAPTAQPAGDDPAITAAANLSRAALVEAAGEALALQSPISEAAPVQTFTAFCQEADGTDTIWIQQVKAETIADATAAARRDCAEDWGFDVEQVHCLGLARGDCQIVHWEDAAP